MSFETTMVYMCWTQSCSGSFNYVGHSFTSFLVPLSHLRGYTYMCSRISSVTLTFAIYLNPLTSWLQTSTCSPLQNRLQCILFHSKSPLFPVLNTRSLVFRGYCLYYTGPLLPIYLSQTSSSSNMSTPSPTVFCSRFFSLSLHFLFLLDPTKSWNSFLYSCPHISTSFAFTFSCSQYISNFF